MPALSTTENEMRAKFDGVIQFDGVRTTTVVDDAGEKTQVVIILTGEMRIVKDDNPDKTLISNHIPYGSTMLVKDGKHIKKGEVICRWDPFNNVIISEHAGKVKFEQIIENVTYRDEMDEQTGHREKVIIETKDKTKVPSVIVEHGKEGKHYAGPVGAHIVVDNGAQVRQGQIIAKIPRVMGKVKDITGGFPRVTELFEARNPEPGYCG